LSSQKVKDFPILKIKSKLKNGELGRNWSGIVPGVDCKPGKQVSFLLLQKDRR
jgi:hypothetical protein